MNLCPETDFGKLKGKPPKRVVCPHCKRRLKPITYFCRITWDYKYKMPKHKPKKWWKNE